MTGQRALVTGGAGFIGSHLVEALAARPGVSAVCVVDDFSVQPSRANVERLRGLPRVQVVEADVRDLDAMRRAAQEATVVYHLATQCLRVSLVDPQLVHEVNVTGSLNVLRAAAEARVRRCVYVSSSEVYGSAQVVPMPETHPCVPTTIYGASKLAGEVYARAVQTTAGLPVVIVRPFNTYGPRGHFEGLYGEVLPKFVLRALAGLPPIIYGDGEQTRDFTYVTDTVRGILLAAECDALVGGVVNIACGVEISVNRLAALVQEVVDTRLAPVHKPPRPADVRRHHADIDLAHRLLGFQPEIGIGEGVAAYVAWFRAAYPDLRGLIDQEETYEWSSVGDRQPV